MQHGFHITRLAQSHPLGQNVCQGWHAIPLQNPRKQKQKSEPPRPREKRNQQKAHFLKLRLPPSKSLLLQCFSPSGLRFSQGRGISEDKTLFSSADPKMSKSVRNCRIGRCKSLVCPSCFRSCIKPWQHRNMALKSVGHDLVRIMSMQGTPSTPPFGIRHLQRVRRGVGCACFKPLGRPECFVSLPA